MATQDLTMTSSIDQSILDKPGHQSTYGSHRPVDPRSQAISYVQAILGDDRDEAAGHTWVAQYLSSKLSGAHDLPEPPLFYSFRSALRRAHFNSMQKWEGAVESRSEDSFIAKLTDLSGKAPTEEAEILISEIEPSDQDLVKPGAKFYWNIGYRDGASGRQRVSQIRFKRYPRWTKAELDAARNESERQSRQIKWE